MVNFLPHLFLREINTFFCPLEIFIKLECTTVIIHSLVKQVLGQIDLQKRERNFVKSRIFMNFFREIPRPYHREFLVLPWCEWRRHTIFWLWLYLLHLLDGNGIVCHTHGSERFQSRKKVMKVLSENFMIFTVCTYCDFSVTRILREINIGI